MNNKPIQPTDSDHDCTAKEPSVLPVELQIELAEMRRSLAEIRYQISVRRGMAWCTPPRHEKGWRLCP